MQRAIMTVFFMFSFVTISHAETCTIKDPEKGFYTIKAGGKTYKAMSEQDHKRLESQVRKDSETIKKLRNQLKNTSDAAKNYVKLTDKYEQLRKDHAALAEKYNKTFSDSVSLIESYKESTTKSLELNDKYNKLAQDFDDLAGKYRSVAVDKMSFISFDVGIGATTNSGNTEPAALLGVGISQVKIWGFLQENNSGAMVGTSFNF